MPRGRRTSDKLDTVLEQIQGQVDQLIEENKNLKKELSRLQAAGADGTSRRTLVGLQRRLQTALGQPSSRTRTTTTATTRRRITDPEVLEKRRAALAKARAVLAEKRASGEG
jgi:cell division septum initiation protein DivIVA